MKPFKFQQFTIQQSEEIFRIGTDGLLLGVLSTVKNAKNAVEIGTGTGFISLMIAQRSPKISVLGLDINPKATQLTEINFKNSPFSERLKAKCLDFKKFKTNQKFDLVFSNPPYFESNPSTKDILARQRIELNFEDLIKKTTEILAPNGIFSVIIPTESYPTFKEICQNMGLHLQKKVLIFGRLGVEAKRNFLEFSFHQSEPEISKLIIEKSPRQYSTEYLDLTKDFHHFQKK